MDLFEQIYIGTITAGKAEVLDKFPSPSARWNRGNIYVEWLLR